MLDNSTPRFVRGYLGQDPEAKVTKNGQTYARVSISVSHYTGKDDQGKSLYSTEWVEATIFDSQYDKTASLVVDSPDYAKGAPVVALLKQGFRDDANLYYKDKNGQIQPFANPVQRPDYVVEAIGLWAKEKRGRGDVAPNAGAAAQPSESPSANDAF